MGVFPILGITEGIFIILLILSKRNKAISDYILSVVFLFLSIYIGLLYFEIYNRANRYPHPILIHSSVPLIFLHGPSIWLYTRSLTVQGFRFSYKQLVHLIPFVLFILYTYLEVYRLPAEQKIIMDSSESFKGILLYPLTVAGIAVSTQGYYITSLLSIRKYNKQIRLYFSHVEEIDLRWLQFFIIATIICFAVISSLYILDVTVHLINYNSQETFVFITGTIYILVLGFYGHRQGNVFTSNTIHLDLRKTTLLKNRKIKKEQKNSDFTFTLLDFMHKYKPFLDPEITIAKLSKELKVSPEYLSNMINNELNRNFFDFINYFRIEEFKLQCKAPENSVLTIIGIAYNCGFNSKATFNRVFKNATGSTPSEYLREVSEK